MKTPSASTNVRFLAAAVLLFSLVESRDFHRIRRGNQPLDANEEDLHMRVSDFDFAQFQTSRKHFRRYDRRLEFEEDDDVDCAPGMPCWVDRSYYTGNDSVGYYEYPSGGYYGGKKGSGYDGKKGSGYDGKKGSGYDGKKGGKGGKGGGKKGSGYDFGKKGSGYDFGKKGGKKGSKKSKEGGCDPRFTCDDRGGKEYEPYNERKEETGSLPHKSFDLRDCGAYSNEWLGELSASCNAASDFGNCDCPPAYALLDSGMVRCANNLQDDVRYVCPYDCEVCQLCMVVEGCPDIYDIHPDK